MPPVLSMALLFGPLALLWEGSVLGAVQGHCSGVRGCGAVCLEPWVFRVIPGHTRGSAVGKQMERCVRKEQIFETSLHTIHRHLWGRQG